MIFKPIISVTVSELPAPSPVKRPFLPPAVFEDRWERDGKWLLGPRILGAIVRHMEGKSLVAIKSGEDYSRIDISLPSFPEVRNEIDGKMVSMYWTVPEELRPILEECCAEAMGFFIDDLDVVRRNFSGLPITASTLADMNAVLANAEQERIARGELELWQILAQRFGIDWRFLPPEPFAS